MGLRSAGAWREFDAPRERVWNALMDTLREQGMSMENVDPLGGTVEAASGLSIWSLGTNLHLKVTPTPEGVRVEAQASAKGLTLVDYGRSGREVNELLDRLAATLAVPEASVPPPPPGPTPPPPPPPGAPLPPPPPGGSASKEDGLRCPSCGAFARNEEARFCGECGTPLRG